MSDKNLNQLKTKPVTKDGKTEMSETITDYQITEVSQIY